MLRETLKQTKKVGIANVVIRTRQYVAALMPVGDVIVMNTLRYANELRAADEFDVPSNNLKAVGVSPREVDMARRLVEGMSDRWKPEEFHDTYHEDLMALIEKRIEAGQTEVVTEPSKEEEERPAKGEVIDLMALLKRSVEGKQRARRTTVKEKPSRSEKHAGRKSA